MKIDLIHQSGDWIVLMQIASATITQVNFGPDLEAAQTYLANLTKIEIERNGY